MRLALVRLCFEKLVGTDQSAGPASCARDQSGKFCQIFLFGSEFWDSLGILIQAPQHCAGSEASRALQLPPPSLRKKRSGRGARSGGEAALARRKELSAALLLARRPDVQGDSVA